MATRTKLSSKGLQKIFGSEMDNLVSEIQSNSIVKKNYTEKIVIKKIIANPYQPRKTFNEQQLKELSDSIKEHGVIQPILVRENVQGYDLIAGERRMRASILAGLKLIPAIILDADDVKMSEIALIENIQRVDLNALEEAISFNELIEKCNLTHEQLSKKIGKSRSYISNSIRLLKLPKKIQQYVMDSKLTLGHVKPLMSLSLKEEELIKMADKVISEEWSVRKTENIISSIATIHKQKSASAVDKNSINFFLENKIMEKLGTKVAIKDSKIIIKYTSVSDLNRILGILNLLNNN